MIFTESIIKQAELLSESFYTLTGNKLVDVALKGKDLLYSLHNAPYVLVSHGVEQDPVFNFANLKAQELWEMNWDEFIKTPSRLSAEAVAQSERQRLLEKAQEHGYISDYNGVRISKSSKRFRIIDTVLWNLTDQQGNYKGQAAMFEKWEYL